MSKMRKQPLNQQGIASLLFSLVMMVVISLIVLSFAQIARNGQREALDNQLNKQAYYAAETGVNDAWHTIQPLINSPNLNTADTGGNCISTPAAAPYNVMPSNALDAGHGVYYTCVKVNTQPPTLVMDGSGVLIIKPSTGTNLTLSWPYDKNSSSNNLAATSPGCPSNFPDISVWKSGCPYDLIRFDLVPLSTPDQGHTMEAFAAPSSAAPGSSLAFTAGPQVGQASCSASTSTCTLVITGPGGVTLPSDPQGYAMRVTSKYYSGTQVTIGAVTSGVTFSDGQVVIDSTGRAQDVKRRIQVRYPLNGLGSSSDDSYLDYAIGSEDSLCKRFTSMPGTTTDTSKTAPGDGSGPQTCLSLP